MASTELALAGIAAFLGHDSSLSSIGGEEFTALVSGGVSEAAQARLTKEAPMLRALLNIGVRGNEIQRAMASAMIGDTVVAATLAKLTGKLSADMFLSGARVGAVDVAVALGCVS